MKLNLISLGETLLRGGLECYVLTLLPHDLFFFFCHATCGISVPGPKMELVPPAVEAQSLNHGTTREVPE